MKRIQNAIQSKLTRRKQRGQTMTEYAIIIALIAIGCIVAVRTLGEQASTSFEKVGNELGTANEKASDVGN